jgi:ABC-type sugar transport system ATPase subunit
LETGAQPRIVVSQAGKRYGALPVFERVDLAVRSREVLAIIGPSGCGKTTLLLMQAKASGIELKSENKQISDGLS